MEEMCRRTPSSFRTYNGHDLHGGFATSRCSSYAPRPSESRSSTYSAAEMVAEGTADC